MKSGYSLLLMVICVEEMGILMKMMKKLRFDKLYCNDTIPVVGSTEICPPEWRKLSRDERNKTYNISDRELNSLCIGSEDNKNAYPSPIYCVTDENSDSSCSNIKVIEQKIGDNGKPFTVEGDFNKDGFLTNYADQINGTITYNSLEYKKEIYLVL